jgi:predicted nucleotidyltransferase/DNA-binding XRE family transcriptional regulator
VEEPATAAALLRTARTRAGLTQADVGERAGVAQSVISAYESGRRQPSVPVLRELIAATGHELAMTLVAARTSPALSGPLGRRLRRRRQRVRRVAAAHGVTNLRVFGSVARGDERPDSDVDLLVDLPADTGLFGFGRLRADLERTLDARVDVVPAEGLKPEIRAAVDAEAVEL